MNIKQFLPILLAVLFIACEKDDIKPIPVPPVEPEQPEKPTTPPTTDDLIKITKENMIVGTNAWFDIAFGNGKYVAVGDNGYISTSTNGTSWTTPKQVGTTRWSKIAYGNGKFFAITLTSYFTTSTNGTTWTTPRKLDVSGGTNDIAYGGGKLILACYSGNLWTSTDDGQTWSNTHHYGSDTWKIVTYANGKFVAVSTNGYAISSVDGETWENRISAINSYYPPVDIAYGNGKFIIVGGKGRLSTSGDAITWPATKYIQNLDFNCIEYSNSKFMAVGSLYENSKYVYYMTTSTDGETWTTKEPLKDESGNAVTNIYGIVGMP